MNNIRRKITILNKDYIAPLCQDGPVVSPLVVDESLAYSLVQKGYTVHEHLTDAEITLTIQNFYNDARFDKVTPPKPIVHTEAVTGTKTTGVAKVVDGSDHKTAIEFSQVEAAAAAIPTETVDTSSTEKVTPPTQTPMSKSERKAAARKAREEAAKAAAAQENATEETTDETVSNTVSNTVSDTEVTE